MLLPLRALSNRRLTELHDAARFSLAGFTRATKAHGSLIQSWVRGAEVNELTHYPEGDVVDRRHGAQLYYHCHRAAGTQHGHVHLFAHVTRSGARRYLGAKTAGTADWTRTAPSHLLAIGLDSRGLPVALFTVNRWVTDGHWFDANLTLSLLRRFVMHAVPRHRHACDWVSGFVRFYEPLIAKLLAARDRRLKRAGPMQRALDDRRLEIVSSVRLNWAGDLERIEREVDRRKSDLRTSNPRKQAATPQTGAA